MSKIQEQLPRLYNVDDAVWGSADLEQWSLKNLVLAINSILAPEDQLKIAGMPESTKADHLLFLLNEEKQKEINAMDVLKIFMDIKKQYKKDGFKDDSPEMKMMKDLENQMKKKGVI